MTRRSTVTVSFDRTILEHPHALHLNRMRSAIWLYLVLVSRRSAGDDTIEIAPSALADLMGLAESTIRTWLGHLKKGRYIAILRRETGSMTLRLKHIQPDPDVLKKRREPTVEVLERALGEMGYRQRLAEAIAAHPPPVIQYALDRATDVPRSKIRRSRTALFFYLLNHENTDQKNDSRY
jgi:hypothetical protein